ncbi:DgyrCDS12930 [Dimorphilus gyrociliatus]|uniref:DgyrCDS12930 n=1 Tax=Dimorphilus gyrociliatus TaxID=2664684 RepID=A0A7I8W975_9ANNE|nr:DgyrCDS12930 [Dimorphilus gyrociliatus]
MIYDFQKRRFQTRTPIEDEILDDDLLDIESAIIKCRTKLGAALARSRIKAQVQHLQMLLPANCRDTGDKQRYFYTWINEFKTTKEEALRNLHLYGFDPIENLNNIKECEYFLDRHCDDVIAFCMEDREKLKETALFKENRLVMQDKSSCLAVNSVKSLVNDDEDILIYGSNSGLDAAHLASLLCKLNNTIYVFIKEEKLDKVKRNFERIGVDRNIQLITDPLESIAGDDIRFKHIKLVLFNAKCTKTAVANPVEFLVAEDEDMLLLKEFINSDTNPDRLGKVMWQINSDLRKCLKFPRVQGIVYLTRSNQEIENETVVKKAIDFINTVQQKKNPFRVSPPVLPLTGEEIDEQDILHGKFIKFPSSKNMSGCFIATLTREAEDIKEAAKDILARAAAKGLFSKNSTSAPNEDNSPPSKPTKKTKKKTKSAKIKKLENSKPSSSTVLPPVSSPNLAQRYRSKDQSHESLLKHDITSKSRDTHLNRDVSHKTFSSPVTAHLYDLEIETSIAKEKATKLPRSRTENRLYRRLPNDNETSINSVTQNSNSSPQRLFNQRTDENGGENFLEMSNASDQLGMARSKSESRILQRANTSESLDAYYKTKSTKLSRFSRPKSKVRLSKKIMNSRAKISEEKTTE